MTDIIDIRPELSVAEQSRLEELTAVVDRHLKSFVEVGRALAEIKQLQLWRGSHESFPHFCRDKWDLGQSHAYRMIDASFVVENLSPIGERFLPQNESQVRPLTEFSKPEQLEIWGAVCEAVGPEGKITASVVAEAVRQYRGVQVKEKLEGLRKSRETQVSKQFDFGFNQFKNEIERALLSKFRDTSKAAILRYLDGLMEIRESISKM